MFSFTSHVHILLPIFNLHLTLAEVECPGGRRNICRQLNTRQLCFFFSGIILLKCARESRGFWVLSIQAGSPSCPMSMPASNH